MTSIEDTLRKLYESLSDVPVQLRDAVNISGCSPQAIQDCLASQDEICSPVSSGSSHDK